METQCDIAVLGAGSNSLTAAAYMAKAGKKVLVLEKNDQCGGGVVSIEIAPGFIHDPHAAGYFTCLSNPAILHDELGLMSRFGLEWKSWDASFATVFEDDTGLISYKDVDRTCEEIARFSQKDAEAYRKLANECLTLEPLLSMASSTPPLPTGSFMNLLESSAIGRKVAASLFNSTYDVLNQHFESPELKMHYLKWIAETMEGPEINGTGMVLYNLLALAHTHKGRTPVGGSRALTNALIRCIEHYGGEVRTGAEVSRVHMSGGRASGLQLADGETITAREAVIANIHPWKLGDYIEGIDPELAAEARTVKLSNHGAINQQIALSTVPKLRAGDRYLDAICVEYMRKGLTGLRRNFDGYRYGEMPSDHLSPLTIMNSLVDPSRAPAGQCSLYLYHFAPRELHDGGLEAWDEHKQAVGERIFREFASYTTNINESQILAWHIESPLDHHRHSGSMVNGDIFGIGSTAGQMLARRPIPPLAQYRVPGVQGLYLAGPFMHPGGTVTLGGRATAINVCRDLGIDLKQVFEAY